MWDSPILWCSLSGITSYVSFYPGLRKCTPYKLLQVAGAAFGLALVLLVIAWVFAAIGYRVSPYALLTDSVPGRPFHRTVYGFYTLTFFAGLVALHAGTLHVLRSHGSRTGS